jgi:PPM family protein phosphatase
MAVSYAWAGATNPGVVRDHNEDAVYPDGAGRGDGGVGAVADGLGGHPGGDVASRLVIEAVAATESDDPVAIVDEARRILFAHIVAAAETRPELIEMATTLTLAVLRRDGVVAVGHAGDSRLYHVRDGSIGQVTEDHTIATALVRRGELSAEEAQGDPRWHIIDNVLGFERNTVETHELAVVPGDTLLLCTDGLSNMVGQGEIAAILGEDSSVEDRAQRLIGAANDAGGVDNISVIVVDVVDG